MTELPTSAKGVPVAHIHKNLYNMVKDKRLFDESHGAATRKFPGGSKELWKAARAYFEWCEANPIRVPKTSAKGTIIHVEMPRAYTRQGLQVWLGISEQTYCRWKNKEHEHTRPDLHAALDLIENIVIDQRLVYGLVGMFSASLVATEIQRSTSTLPLAFDAPVEGAGTVIEHDAAVYAHPDDPDPEASGWRFTRDQLASKIPFPTEAKK